MELAIELFGYLILTILGFMLPVVAILLSIYHEGLSKLAQQYQAEVSQSEENLKTIAKAKKTDLAAIQQSIKELESTKKRATTKLSYLNPRKQIIRLFIPLVLAFLGVVATSILIGTNVYYGLFLLISLTGFVYALIVLWNLIAIIVEVRGIIDTEKKTTETSTVELLTSLAREVIDRTGQYFLTKVYIVLDGKDIEDDSYETTIPANIKKEINVQLRNNEMRMAKNVEIGFRFPTNFIIDKTDYASIFRDEKEQVVRYSESILQGHTIVNYAPLIITPLEQGVCKVSTFIKAENIAATYRSVTIRVT